MQRSCRDGQADVHECIPSSYGCGASVSLTPLRVFWRMWQHGSSKQHEGGRKRFLMKT